MNDKKKTDSDIKRALECCSKAEIYADCKKMKCPLFLGLSRGCKYVDKENQLYSDALDLINRLQAQNKDLAEAVHNLTLEKDALFDKSEELKSEVERLKEFIVETRRCDKEIKSEVVKEFADKVAHDIISYCEKNIRTKPSVDGVTGMKISNDLIYKRLKETVSEDNV